MMDRMKQDLCEVSLTIPLRPPAIDELTCFVEVPIKAPIDRTSPLLYFEWWVVCMWALTRGERVVQTRFNVDEDVCTGDHSCIRLSGCPSLTIKESSDPLKKDPVATVIQSCVGCGHCGEVAHEAILCPSFYRTEIVRNARWYERASSRARRWAIGKLEAWS